MLNFDIWIQWKLPISWCGIILYIKQWGWIPMNEKEKEMLEKISNLFEEMTGDTKELMQGLKGISSRIQDIGNGLNRIEATQKDIIEELKQQSKR